MHITLAWRAFGLWPHSCNLELLGCPVGRLQTGGFTHRVKNGERMLGCPSCLSRESQWPNPLPQITQEIYVWPWGGSQISCVAPSSPDLSVLAPHCHVWPPAQKLLTKEFSIDFCCWWVSFSPIGGNWQPGFSGDTRIGSAIPNEAGKTSRRTRNFP